MPKSTDQEGRVVRTILTSNVKVGKPSRKNRLAANISMAQNSQFYDTIMSADMLELPQPGQNEAAVIRHFYEYDEYVGAAIDMHTQLPLSKIRLEQAECPDVELSEKSYRFFFKMCKRIKLFKRLVSILFDYNLHGEAVVWAEDSADSMPLDVRHTTERYINDYGKPVEEHIVRDDADTREVEWYKKHYKGWDKITTLPPECVEIKTFPFSNFSSITILHDDQTRALVNRADIDPVSAQAYDAIPQELRPYLTESDRIPLGTDPNKGSFVYHLARAKSDYQERGVPVLRRCLKTLIYRDKLRQAQTQIASRAMTPKRLIWAEDLSPEQLEDLRDQVDMSLMDPDFSIITNYQVNWEELGARDRLLDLASEDESANKRLVAGLGITEGLITGEATYSGDRMPIEAINTKYMLLREHIQEYVHDYLFEPIARKKGFVYIDEDGDEIAVYPTIGFTRMALTDSQDAYDKLYNLYQKGSIPISVILDLLNIEPRYARKQLEQDLFTVNDPNFNEVLRSLYGEIGRALVEQSNAVAKTSEYLSLKPIAKEGSEEDNRFK